MVMPTSQDSFISDDEEELCPLCVEEMDLSDKNFKPCPCGYQVCQFCYNNIRQNPQLNGRCPACRRPYDDDAVEYRMISQEEWKQDHLRQTRKERERKQREREKKEQTEQQTSKKHLSGMRVIQKNLVYVIGLNPNIPTDELHNTLRGDQFFGQYGKIQKIVINRRNNANGNPGLGVYVTFARKEDAAKCIAAVDGSINDGKYLRAAYGTTKYCSSYLRGQPCPNPNCMFLHEPGEEADSYTRQDLSTIQHTARGGGDEDNGSSNIQSSNQSQSNATSIASASPAPALTPTPTSQPHKLVSRSTHDDNDSSTLPALPASVSWAHKPSPPTTSTKLHNPKVEPTPTPSIETVPPHLIPQPEPPSVDPTIKIINDNLESLSNGSFSFVFSSNILTEEDLNKNLPPYFSFSKSITNDSKSINIGKFASLFSTFNKTGGLGCNKGYSSLSIGQGYQEENQQVQQQQLQQQLQQQPQQQQQTSQQQTQYSEVPVSTATPPPGLHANQQSQLPQLPPLQPHVQSSQNSHELLAHLMNGGPKGEH